MTSSQAIARKTGLPIVFEGELTEKITKIIGYMLGLAATIVASLVPSLTILWLYRVQRTVTRIRITIGLAVLIGVILRVATKANMKEIFGITAA